MKSAILFLKWFFIPRKALKFHTAVPKRPLMVGVSSGRLAEIVCAECGATFYSYAKNPEPVCTAWSCFKKYNLAKAN